MPSNAPAIPAAPPETLAISRAALHPSACRRTGGRRIAGPLRSLGVVLVALAGAACFKPTGLTPTTESSGSESGGSTHDAGTTPGTTTTPTTSDPTSGLTTGSTTTTGPTTTTATLTTSEATTGMPGTTQAETGTSESSTTSGGVCGDDILDPGEQCDDGNTLDSDGCQHNCMLPGCGDGILDRGEQCDDGNATAKDGCNLCIRDAAFVFVSSMLYTSDLGGPFGGDAKCQALATKAGLPGNYQAWLSVDILAAPQHIVPVPLPYIRPDAVLVADSFASIVLPGPMKLKAPISVTELGEPLPGMRNACDGGPPVWTGTDASGLTVSAGNCNGWAMLAAIDPAVVGRADATDAAWTQGCAMKCSAMAHLYCFEAK